MLKEHYVDTFKNPMFGCKATEISKVGFCQFVDFHLKGLLPTGLPRLVDKVATWIFKLILNNSNFTSPKNVHFRFLTTQPLAGKIMLCI